MIGNLSMVSGFILLNNMGPFCFLGFFMITKNLTKWKWNIED